MQYHDRLRECVASKGYISAKGGGSGCVHVSLMPLHFGLYDYHPISPSKHSLGPGGRRAAPPDTSCLLPSRRNRAPCAAWCNPGTGTQGRGLRRCDYQAYFWMMTTKPFSFFTLIFHPCKNELNPMDSYLPSCAPLPT